MNPKYLAALSKAGVTLRDSEPILMLLPPIERSGEMKDKHEDEVVHRKCLVIICHLMDGQMDR